MDENFKKGEFNLVQVIKLGIMVIGGIGIVSILSLILLTLLRIEAKL